MSDPLQRVVEISEELGLYGDLTERLRGIPNSDGVQFEAADRIEHLERVLWQVREAMRLLLGRDERNTCQHSDTYRGGAIWEICNDCGAKWADDEGGKPKWKDPGEWLGARKAIAAIDEALKS